MLYGIDRLFTTVVTFDKDDDMEIGITHSVNGVPIRLSHERVFHIFQNHPELAGRTYEILETVHSPETVLEGANGECLAVRKVDHRYLVVVYREGAGSGFVITCFLTSKIEQIRKRKHLWPK